MKTTLELPDDLFVEAKALAAQRPDLIGRKPNLVIDLHADSAQAVPYVLIDRPVSMTGATR